MDNMLTIGQLSNKYSVSSRSIRHYEKLGILNSYRDANSNYRFYGESESQRLYQIILLKSMGFSLKEVSLILGKKVCKNDITNIIKNRLNALDKRAAVLQYCKEMLEKLIDACCLINEHYVDCQLLLNQVMESDSGNEKVDRIASELFYSQIELNNINDIDLEFLKSFSYMDNYCLNKWSITMEQEDIDRMLFLLNAVSNKDFWNIYVPEKMNFIDYFRRQDDWALTTTQIYNLGLKAKNTPLKSGTKISYRDILLDLSDKLNLKSEGNSQAVEIERTLIIKLFTDALLRYDSIDTITPEGLGTITAVLELNQNAITRELIVNSIAGKVINDNNKLLHIIKMIIDAECRHIYAGTGNNHFDEVQAINHELTRFTRVLEWSIKELWYYLNYLGQSYTLLMSIILRVAYMRLKSICYTNISQL